MTKGLSPTYIILDDPTTPIPYDPKIMAIYEDQIIIPKRLKDNLIRSGNINFRMHEDEIK